MPKAAQLRVARPPVPSLRGGIPSREPTADLRPTALRGSGGNPGEIDRMLRGHPGIAAGARDLRYAVGSTAVEYVAPDDATPSEVAFAELCQQVLVDEVFVNTDAEQRGWSELGATLAQHWIYGHTWHSPRIVDAPGTRRAMAIMDGRGVELYPVHPSTVSQINGVAPEYTRLESIRQQTRTTSALIPASRLIHTQHGGAPGEWEGESVLRPLVFLFERWVGLWTSAERLAAFASGVLKVREPAGADEASVEQMRDTIVDWMGGYQPVINIPSPWPADAVEFSYPTGTGPDTRGQSEYIDAQINAALGRALHSLGFTAHGSRALGEATADADAWTSYAQLQTLLESWGLRTASWLAREIGFYGRVPSLRVVDEAAPDMSERVTTLSAAVGAGMLTWGRGDEHELREALGLPEAPPEPAQQPTTPALSDCCGHVTLADPPPGRGVRVVDAGGEEWWAPRDLRGPEIYVRWAEQDREMERANAALTAAVESIAAEHRAAVWLALSNGWSPANLSMTYDAYRDRYRDEIQRHADAVLDIVREQSASELAAQQAAGLPVTDADDVSGRDLVSPAVTRLPAFIDTGADEMASRVQGEVEQAWSSGVTQSAFTSQITPDGLARPGKAVGERVLAEGRVIVGADLAPGVSITKVVRTGIRDTAQCPVCRDRDGAEFDLPADEDGYRAMPLPDPDCHGGVQRCRCGWLVVWGRRA